ncbi:hypothetical protein fugu_004089 [Takifugu bimaculatus]|uniref:Uncharacterized protein n=2 Tax=Takifugu TaxID=31032 RepID=A0A5C6N3J0_9TELE|nr:hypothetical protein fugu_004089 [Takifugu bimaculatus]TWW60921.1 hypothetical protein D4764_05G0010110 [Takifugu flavidus]
MFPVMSGSMSSGAEMSTAQLIQQMAMLRWLDSQSDEDRTLLAAVTSIQVSRELLHRITNQDKVDAYKKQCILGIAQFVREHPRASQADITAEVEKRVLVFAAQIRALETAPLF